ncbi:MAG: hypothetical protein M1834_004630 [Cirrosporium novae-zelandiae]|nr:MAG: hypothetical protein M1834_004630 [Cirrosporium novae-zelandiae]
MSSLTLKLGSLAIRTLAKPIGNRIKAQAREHERFRRYCVRFAQFLHRTDMRMRLGLINDQAALDRQAAREAAEVAKKNKPKITTVKTEAQVKLDELRAKRDVEKDKEVEKPAPKPKIRPLSEAKAIDTGASFVSEAFIFLVAGSLIVFESYRSRRKENSRREDVADQLRELKEGAQADREAIRQALLQLEKEVLRQRHEHDKEKAGLMTKISYIQHHDDHEHIIPRTFWSQQEQDEKEDEKEAKGWFVNLSTYFQGSKKGQKQTIEDSKDPSKPNSITAKASKPENITSAIPIIPSSAPLPPSPAEKGPEASKGD